MGKYVARRLLVAIPTLLGATVLVFLLLRVLPGDVTNMILGGEGGSSAMPWTAERLREELGLNRPLYLQYFAWLGDVVRADLGESLFTGRSVRAEFLHRIPLTLEIAILSEIMGIIIGIPLGIVCALRQDSPFDYGLRGWSIFFLAIPSFWLGLMVILVGVRFFDWMPPIGYYAIWDDPKNNLLQLFWPAFILSLHEQARIGRMTRSTMLEVMREDYIRTARAKGLSERVVLVRHALKNAMIPIVTFTSVYFAAHFGGTVVLEVVFSIPGVGLWFYDSIRVRDYTAVQALVLFLATVFIMVDLFVDLLYGWLDPRISYG